MAFLDEEDEIAPASAGSHGRRYLHRRQIMFRRAIALGVTALVLLLIILGIRGCLNARSQRSFESYASGVSSIAAQTKPLSDDLFGRLSNTARSQTGFKTQVSTDSATAAALTRRLEALSVPDQLTTDQQELILAFELRSDGLSGIADQVSGSGAANSLKVTDAVASDMKDFLASDVLYQRARDDINRVLAQQGVSQHVPESVFLPDPERWLDPLQVSQALATVAGGKVTPGIHGMALTSTTIGGVAITTDTPASVSGSELDVSVQNQGDVTEKNVVVVYKATGGTTTLEKEATIPSIASQGIQTAKLPINPPKGVALTIQVTVEPVPGEQIVDNNTATYTVTFH